MHAEGRLIDGRTNGERYDLSVNTQDTTRQSQLIEAGQETQDDLLLFILALLFTAVLLEPSTLDLEALQCISSCDRLIGIAWIELLELIDVVALRLSGLAREADQAFTQIDIVRNSFIL